ncbi:SPOR domain-containing protein [Candidatus Cardinium hertigii]|nr:SPOR domain-containing protein [Candidatus Cardinium hertigii]
MAHPKAMGGTSHAWKLKKKHYEENLAPYRMEFCKRAKKEKKEPLLPLTMQWDQTQYLESLLAKRKIAYKRMNSLKFYTIQVYMGNSRAAALEAQELVRTLQSTYVPEFNYRQPYYTVRMGLFTDKLEAYFVYLTLIKRMPSAMIRPCMLTKEDYVAYKASCKALLGYY